MKCTQLQVDVGVKPFLFKCVSMECTNPFFSAKLTSPPPRPPLHQTSAASQPIKEIVSRSYIYCNLT
jgi:hypothetical protein